MANTQSVCHGLSKRSGTLRAALSAALVVGTAVGFLDWLLRDYPVAQSTGTARAHSPVGEPVLSNVEGTTRAAMRALGYGE